MVSISVLFDYESQMLEVNVKDTGIGIKKEDQDKVFKIVKDQESIGLGLSICKKIASKNDGVISFTSEY